MDIASHTTSSNLQRYSFFILLALLVLSAGALFLGGRPPVTLITGNSSMAWSLLNVSWIVSGAAAVYLGYQWLQHNKQIFGDNDTKDTVAFGFMILSGLNIGILGVLNINLYFQLVAGYVAFIITGAASLACAGYVFKRWQESGETLFPTARTMSDVEPVESQPQQESMS